MKSHKTLYIVCNLLPPEYQWVTKAPGLRAQQLARQASDYYEDVKYIIFYERLRLSLKNRGIAEIISARDDMVLIERNDYSKFVSRLPESIFIFTQADFCEEAEIALNKHHVIYDILASKTIELEVAGKPREIIEDYSKKHLRMIQMASVILINGPKLAGLMEAELRNRDNVFQNRFWPISVKKNSPHAKWLIFGGSVQAWTDNQLVMETMLEYFARNHEQQSIMFASNPELHDESSRAISALTLNSNIRVFQSMTLCNYAEILVDTLGFIDVCPNTREREYSTSTRVLQAVSAGIPVLHQKDTALEMFWSSFPGHLVDPEKFTADDVESFIDSVRSGVYADIIANIHAEMNNHLNSAPFYEGL